MKHLAFKPRLLQDEQNQNGNDKNPRVKTIPKNAEGEELYVNPSKIQGNTVEHESKI